MNSLFFVAFIALFALFGNYLNYVLYYIFGGYIKIFATLAQINVLLGMSTTTANTYYGIFSLLFLALFSYAFWKRLNI